MLGNLAAVSDTGHLNGIVDIAQEDPPRSPCAQRILAINQSIGNGAQERTRTSTTLRPLAPEASASASSATWANR